MSFASLAPALLALPFLLAPLSDVPGADLPGTDVPRTDVPTFGSESNAQPARSIDDEEDEGEPEVTHTVTHSSSLWKKSKNAVTGGFRIVETVDGERRTRTLELADDFRTKKGPDLKIVLSPLSYTEATSKKALDGGLVLGLLERFDGASRFEVPADADLSRYRSLLVHCEEYTLLWAAAPLGAGEVVARGTQWTKKTKKVSGSFEIAAMGERSFELRVGPDFDTSSAPDLKWVLSPHTVAEAKNGNALEGGLIIAALTDDEGAQSFRFELPEGRDLNDFASLLVHCEQYTKLWGAAAL